MRAAELSERGYIMCVVYCNIGNQTSCLHHRAHRAFTLVEVIVVVVILAIAALIAVPVFTGASQTQLKAAADKLVADIEYAKSMAVTMQKNYKVTFDLNQESYSLRDDLDSVITDPIKKGSPYTVTYPQESRLDGVTVVSADFNGTTTVQFDYKGSPLDAAGNAIASGSVTIGAGGHTMVVRVEPVTGYISIQ